VPEIVRLDVSSGSFQALAAGPAGGPLALVLHGFPDIPPTFAPLVDELAGRGFRVLAPWLRGYAPSTLTGPYDVETLADDVLAIADRVAAGRPVHLIGHDWGAVITYVACAAAPSRVAAAVTIAVPHPLAFLSAAARTRQLLRSWYVALFQLPGAERLAAAHDFALIDRLWRTWSPGYRLPAALRDELHECLRASWPAPLLYYRAIFRPLRPAVRRLRPTTGIGRRITVPVLYLHGADDGCVGWDAARGAERHFAGRYRAELIDGAGHFLPAERPREVAARAAAWMADAGCVSGIRTGRVGGLTDRAGG
jgi:pimeloyl-ACP methyl ester carboxylesterase